MDSLVLIIAFTCGFAVKQLGQPPLVGYLAAGFILSTLGIVPSDALDLVANAGISLMLFTIGLKLDIKSLLKTEIYGATLSHMTLSVVVAGGFLLFLAALGLPLVIDITWEQATLLGFALSFSSTVCAVKILEDRGELRVRHGQIAMGILVMQDIVAVVFLTISTGKTPSVWAVLLPLLFFARPLFGYLLRSSGHDELLPLTGFLLTFAGCALFDLVGLKADLGAIVFGVLVGADKKSGELAKSMLSFKDIFLIGFFLTIGLSASPTWAMFGVALALCLLLPIKNALFFLLLTRFKMRARTAMLGAFSLTNYSEFGLLVAALSLQLGWLNEDWIAILAITVALSFVLSTLLNNRSHLLYAKFKDPLKKFETDLSTIDDPQCPANNVDILIVGMGRVGTGAYNTVEAQYHLKVCGVDTDHAKVAAQNKAGRRVIYGDAEDADFWEGLKGKDFKLVMFTMPSLAEMIDAVVQLRLTGYNGKVAAVAKHEDEQLAMLEAGADVVFNYYAEAGAGFAEHTISNIFDVLPAKPAAL